MRGGKGAMTTNYNVMGSGNRKRTSGKNVVAFS